MSRVRPRAALLAALAEGEIGLLVGTHALLEKPVAFRRLGLVVVDEQHRFGVAQRATLPARVGADGLHPHVLVLSATPIPRSLALALHGDLDVSTLAEKPPGRTPVVTRVLDEGGREEAYRALARELESGGRAYVVVPLVDDSETIDARAVASWTDEVARRLPGRRVGAVHGKMRAEAREKAMRQFAAGDLDVLVATTVVEVGIDVPEASFLLVENAETVRPRPAPPAARADRKGSAGRRRASSSRARVLRPGRSRASPSSPGPKTDSRSRTRI